MYKSAFKFWEKIYSAIFTSKSNSLWLYDECIIGVGCHIFASFADSMILKKLSASTALSNPVILFFAKISLHETIEQLAKTGLSYLSYYNLFSITQFFYSNEESNDDSKNDTEVEKTWLDVSLEMTSSAFFSITFEKIGSEKLNIQESENIFTLNNFYLGSLSAFGSIIGHNIYAFFRQDEDNDFSL